MMKHLVRYYRTLLFMLATVIAELALLIARGGHP